MWHRPKLYLALLSCLVSIPLKADDKLTRRLPARPAGLAPLAPLREGSRMLYPYAFDGHVHTAYSHDADHPPALVLAAAEQAGLDALIVTDHGTHIAQREFHAHGGGLTVFPGQEVGGPYGHAVMWNVPARHNTVSSETTLAQRAAFAHRHGGLIVLCHPGWWIDPRERDPMTWMTAAALSAGGESAEIDAIELWNGVYDKPLRKLVDAWLTALDGGAFKPIVGGSDFHRLGAHQLGGPRTVALCTSAEPRSCLWDAIRKGHLYVTDGPSAGLRVEDAIMGDELEAQPGSVLTVHVSAFAPLGGELRVFLSRALVRTRSLTARTTLEETFSIEVPAHDAYVRLEIVHADGAGRKHDVQLLSNPVRLKVLPPEAKHTPSAGTAQRP